MDISAYLQFYDNLNFEICVTFNYTFILQMRKFMMTPKINLYNIFYLEMFEKSWNPYAIEYKFENKSKTNGQMLKKLKGPESKMNTFKILSHLQDKLKVTLNSITNTKHIYIILLIEWSDLIRIW